MESMNAACVHCRPDEDELKITFYHNEQRIDLNRKTNDSLKKTLDRIAIKLKPKKSKSKKKKKETEEESNSIEDIICSILDGNVDVSKDLTNQEGFTHGRTLQINDNKYFINVNPPTINKLVLPVYIMAGFPIIPNVKFELASLRRSKFTWYKSDSPKNLYFDWKRIGEGCSYTPSVGDIGFYIKCMCYPGSDSGIGPFFEESICEEPIRASPGVCLFDERHLYTPKYHEDDSDEFRVVTYNILANVFADTEYARGELFPYCPPYAIKSDYRRQLMLKELIGYHADIVCLQECSLHEYEDYLYNWMSSHGYEGFLKLKVTEMAEGEACLYRKDRYDHIEDLSISIKDALLLPSNESLLKKLQCIPPLLENIQSKSAIGQIHVLKEKHGKCRFLCVLNTHLYYKRYSPHVRLLQITVLMNYLHDVLQKYKDVSILVSGDMNSLRGEPLLEYLLGTNIKENHLVWESSEIPEENGLCMNLQCPISLKLLSGQPDFTSYTPHCVATLDYIFGDCGIGVERFVPLPSAADLDVHTGIPSVVYPSDHLAVILDLKWN